MFLFLGISLQGFVYYNCYHHDGIIVVISLASRDAYFAVKYNNLLANIAEVGRDVKPAYTNNKSSSERLRKSKMAIMNDNIINVVHTDIVITRNTIRDLMVELEKYSRIADENDMDYNK